MTTGVNVIVKVREGSQEPRDFKLIDDDSGTQTVVDLSSANSITMYLKPVRGGGPNISYTTDGQLTTHQDSANEWYVRWIPDDQIKYRHSEYKAYFVVNDAAGRNVDFPGSGHIIIRMLESLA